MFPITLVPIKLQISLGQGRDERNHRNSMPDKIPRFSHHSFGLTEGTVRWPHCVSRSWLPPCESHETLVSSLSWYLQPMSRWVPRMPQKLQSTLRRLPSGTNVEEEEVPRGSERALRSQQAWIDTLSAMVCGSEPWGLSCLTYKLGQ